jgi:hypothetical protein
MGWLDRRTLKTLEKWSKVRDPSPTSQTLLQSALLAATPRIHTTADVVDIVDKQLKAASTRNHREMTE